jgi:hypothetical protein
MNRKLRFILWLSRELRLLADWLDWCELRLLSAAQRRGWLPEAPAARAILLARQHRERVTLLIQSTRAAIAEKQP